jgi:WD40 repeat protein
VLKVLFSPSGKHVLSIDEGGMAKVWESESGIVRRTFPSRIFRGSPFLQGLAPFSTAGTTSPDGKLIVLADPAGKQLEVCRFDDLSEVAALGEVKTVLFSPDGRRLLADGTKLWDLEAGRSIPLEVNPEESKPLDSTPVDFFLRRQSTSFSPDGKHLVVIVSGPRKKTEKQAAVLSIFEVATGRKIATETLGGGVGPGFGSPSLVFAPDGRTFLTAGLRGPGAGGVIVWDTATGKKRLTLDVGQGTGPVGLGTIPHFNPDGTRVVLSVAGTRPGGGLPTVFDVNTGAKLFRLELVGGLNTLNTPLAYSPDGKRIATVEGLTRIIPKIWDASTGRELLHFKPEFNAFGAPTGTLRSARTAIA